MPAALEDDLRRRDFGVNALALDASGERPGIFGDDSSLADLDRRRLRVLHGASFRDDPTRLLRLARYHARLAFEIEPHTRELAREAIGAEALSTVSGPRVGHELRLLAREPDPVAAMNAVRELGLERAIHPDLEIDLGLAEAALRALPVEGRAELVVLAAACSALPPGELSDFTGRLGFDRGEARVAVALTESLPAAAARLAGARRPSEIDAELSGRTLEEAALLAALGSAEPVRRWLEELRHIRLDIDGDDLRRAGAPEGPAIGAGLARARAGRLDGELPTREAQLEAALRMQQR
jgi:tRNA nucleotidyltransferase (CCA-adding enzyme)